MADRAPSRPAPDASRRPAWRRLESWLWTGPLGHLAGGAVDFAEALGRYWLRRVRHLPRDGSAGV